MKRLTGARRWLALCLAWAVLLTGGAIEAASLSARAESEAVEAVTEEVGAILGDEAGEPAEVFAREASEPDSIEWAEAPKLYDDGVETVTLTKNTSLKLNVGEQRRFAVSTGAVSQWTNSKPEVAELNFDGKQALVRAMAAGKTTLKAKVGSKTLSVTLTVVDPTLPTGIELPYKSNQEIDYRNRLELKCTLLPEGVVVSGVT